MCEKIINKNILIEIKNNIWNNISSSEEITLFNCFRKKYKKKILELKNILDLLEYNVIIKQKNINAQLNLNEEYLLYQKNEIKKNLNCCVICYDNKIDTVLVPCGHLFCNKCIENSSECYFCRSNIQIKQHMIYL